MSSNFDKSFVFQLRSPVPSEKAAVQGDSRARGIFHSMKYEMIKKSNFSD